MKIAGLVALAYSVSPLNAQNHGKPRQLRQLSAKTAKTAKSSKSTTTSPDAPVDDPCPGVDLQDGYSCGMAPEIAGLWAGDERFYVPPPPNVTSDGVTYRYCTRALFNPANGQNFLNWNAALLDCDQNNNADYYYCGGTGAETCADIGVDPLGKTINGNWWGALSFADDSYFTLQIEQKQCIDECDYDVTADLPGYTVKAKACGAHLKRDNFRPDEFSCELYQTNLIEDADGNQEVVVVLTYLTYTGGYANFRCPERPTFDQAQLESDPDADGMTLFVLQNGLTNTSNPAAWDCLVEGSVFD